MRADAGCLAVGAQPPLGGNPIVAASSTEQLDESLDALSVELTAQQLTALDEAPTVYGTWSTTS